LFISVIGIKLSPGSIIRCQRKLGGKQAQRATHWPRVRGPVVLTGVLLRVILPEINVCLWAIAIYISGWTLTFCCTYFLFVFFLLIITIIIIIVLVVTVWR